MSAARSSAGDFVEERRKEGVVYPGGAPPPPPPQVTFAPPPQPAYDPAPAHAPMIVNAAPPQQQQPAEYVNTTTARIVRDVSPSRTASSYTSYDTYTTDSTSIYAPQQPYAMNAQPQYAYGQGPPGMALVPVTTAVDKARHRSRSRHHRHSSRDVAKAERLPNGELVLFEETVERVEEPNRGVRLEKDKRGRMSISVPRYPRA